MCAAEINSPKAPQSLSDDEIVATAIYASADDANLSFEDRATATLASYIHATGLSPMSYVLWPSGVRMFMACFPGARDGAARTALIAAYRAAEAGQLGPLHPSVPK